MKLNKKFIPVSSNYMTSTDTTWLLMHTQHCIKTFFFGLYADLCVFFWFIMRQGCGVWNKISSERKTILLLLKVMLKVTTWSWSTHCPTQRYRIRNRWRDTDTAERTGGNRIEKLKCLSSRLLAVFGGKSADLVIALCCQYATCEFLPLHHE